MEPSRKLKRVTLASGSRLCEEKLFLPEDCPSKVDNKYEDHLQAKTLSIWPSTTNEHDDLPPGFECIHLQNQSNDEFSSIPRIKWECPPSFALNSGWLIAAGEQSTEKDDHKLREMQGPEALCPENSSIPPRPYESLDVEKEGYNDSLTPQVPLTPIEEEESVEGIKHDIVISPATFPVNSQCSGMPLVPVTCLLEGDLNAAFAIAKAIVKRNNEEGNWIDANSLLKIVNDPILIGKITQKYRKVITNVESAPSGIVSIPSTSSVSVSSATLESPVSTQATTHKIAQPTSPPPSPRQRIKRVAPQETQSTSFCKKMRSVVGFVSSRSDIVEDVKSYKNLDKTCDSPKQDMQRHNNFKELKQPYNNTNRLGEKESKIRKPCKYFKSLRGCCNGINCRYLHDKSVWKM